MSRKDLDKTLEWHNSQNISESYLGHPFPVSPEMEEKWYDSILTSNIPTSVFGIENEEHNLLIGLTVLKNINLINRSAEFAMYIGNEDFKGKGYSKIAAEKTLLFGFRNLNLNRIYLKVLENNHIAINLYEKLGFKKEGELRQSVFKNDCYLNEYQYSLLKSECSNEI